MIVLLPVRARTARPRAIIDTFATVKKIWAGEAVETYALFGEGKNVAGVCPLHLSLGLLVKGLYDFIFHVA